MANGPGNPSSIKDLLNRYNQTISASAPKELDPWGMEQVDPDTVLMPGGVYTSPDETREQEQWDKDWQNKNALQKAGSGIKKGYLSMKGGIENFAAEILPKIAGATSGIITPGGYNPMASEVVKQGVVPLKEKALTSIQQAEDIKGKGFYFQAGQFIPQVVGSVAALMAAPFTGGTSLSVIPGLIGIVNIGLITSSVVGNTLAEVDQYAAEKNKPINESTKWAVALTAGAAEFAAEKIRLGRFIPKGLTSKMLTGILKETPEAAEDMLKQWAKSNPSMYKKLLEFIKVTTQNGFEEGSEEFLTQFLQDYANYIYQDKEDRLGLKEILGNSFESAKGGFMMGGFIGPMSYASNQLTTKMRRERQGGMTLVQTTEGNVLELVGADGKGNLFVQDNLGRSTQIKETDVKDRLSMTGDQMNQYIDAYEKGQDIAPQLEEQAKQNEVVNTINQYGQQLKFGDTPLEQDPNPVISFGNTKFGQKLILRNQQNTNGDDIFVAYDAGALKESQYDFEATKPIFVKATDVIERKDVPYDEWMNNELAEYESTMQQADNIAAAAESPFTPGQTINYKGKQWVISDITTNGLEVDEIGEDGLPGASTIIPQEEFNNIPEYAQQAQQQSGDQQPAGTMPGEQGQPAADKPQAREISDGKDKYTITPTDEEGSYSIDKVFYTEKQANTVMGKLQEYYPKLNFKLNVIDSGDDFTPDQYTISARSKKIRRAPRQEAQPEPVAEQQIDPATLPLKEFVQAELDKLPKGARPEYRGQVEIKAKETHKNAVANALQSGAQLPPEILSDYPELSTPLLAQPEPSTPDETAPVEQTTEMQNAGGMEAGEETGTSLSDEEEVLKWIEDKYPDYVAYEWDGKNLEVAFKNQDNTVKRTRQDLLKEGVKLNTTQSESNNPAIDLAAADSQAETNPSDAQKEAGNYKHGHMSFNGMEISIENPAGSVRSGTDQNGNDWSVLMNNSYGYIRGTEGSDGDYLDVFMGDNLDSDKVYVIDQVNPETNDFDEHKVILGAVSRQDAIDTYQSNYDPSWKGLGNITELTMDDFKKWAYNKKRTQEPIYKEEKKKESKIKAGSRTSNVLAIEPGDFTEAVLHFFVAGGKVDRNDFIRHTGLKGKDLQQYNFLLSNDGAKLDVFHERLDNSFGMEDEGAMDMANEVIEIMTTFPSKAKMLKALEVRYNIGTGKEEMTDEQAAADYTPEVPIDEVAPGAVDAIINQAMGDQYLADILNTGEFTDEEGNTDWNKIKDMIETNEGYFKQFPFGLTDDELQNLKSIADENTKNLSLNAANHIQTKGTRKAVTEAIKQVPQNYSLEAKEKIATLTLEKQAIQDKTKDAAKPIQEIVSPQIKAIDEEIKKIAAKEEGIELPKGEKPKEGEKKEPEATIPKSEVKVSPDGTYQMLPKKEEPIVEPKIDLNDQNVKLYHIGYSAKKDESLIPDSNGIVWFSTSEDAYGANKPGVPTTTIDINAKDLLVIEDINGIPTKEGIDVINSTKNGTKKEIFEEAIKRGYKAVQRSKDVSVDPKYVSKYLSSGGKVNAEKVRSNQGQNDQGGIISTESKGEGGPNLEQQKQEQPGDEKEQGGTPAQSAVVNPGSESKGQEDITDGSPAGVEAGPQQEAEQQPVEQKQPEFAGDLFSQPEPPKTRSIEFAGDWFNNTVAVDVESNNLSKEEKEIQNRFEKDLTENYQERKAEYLSKFGREISADNAKELSNDYRSNRTKFTEAVHEPSSKFAKRLFSELVAEEAPNGYDNSVRFSSGGTGAGKTTVLRFMSNLNSLKPSVTYDSNFNSLEGSKEKIDYALKNGKNIEVVFVYRDPVLSFTHGVIPRMNKIGRVIPLSTHIETHANSIENIKKLYDLYKGKIDFWLFDNSNSKGEIKRISPEELPKLIVNKKEATNELRNYIEDQRERGLLSQEQYSAIVGRYISEFNDDRDSETNGAGSQRNTEGSTDKQVNNNVNSLNEPKEEYKGQPLSGSQSENAGTETKTGDIQRQENTGKNPYRGLKGDTYDEVNRLVKRYQVKVFDLKEFNYWFNKFSVKGGVNPTLLAFQVYEQMQDSPGQGRRTLFKVSDSVYFSPVQKALDAIKQNKATPHQWKAMFLKNGAKQAELDWMGWDEFANDKRVITKAKIQDWIDQNKIRVEEVQKGGFQWKGNDLIVGGKVVANLIHNEDGTWSYQSDFSEGEEAWETKLDAQKEAEEAIIGDAYSPYATKYSQYTLPGGENYKELLLTMPDLQRKNRLDYNRRFAELKKEVLQRLGDNIKYPAAFNLYDAKHNGLLTPDELSRLNSIDQQANKKLPENFKSSHFEEPNILAHVRFNTRRTQDGKNILFIEEIQSDWAQKGKKEGFKSDNRKAITESLRKEKDNFYTKLNESEDKQVEYGLSQFESGKINREQLDKILLANGYSEYDLKSAVEKKSVPDMPYKKTDQWAGLVLRRMIRYAIDNGFDAIAWTPGEVQAERYDLSKQVDNIRYYKSIDGDYELRADKDGREVMRKNGIPESKLDDYVGKEIAKKIINQEGEEPTDGNYHKTLYGLALKVGGTGMKGFYDNILPSIANKIGKKFGSQVVDGRITTGGDYFEQKNYDGWYDIYNTDDELVEQGFVTREEALHRIDQLDVQNKKTVHTLPITPSMFDAYRNGVPMFRVETPTGENILDEIAGTQKAKNIRQKEIRTRIEILSNELNTPVTIINDRSELPKHIQDDIKTYASDAKKIPGIYDPENDAVYLLINELYDVKEAIGVVLHEVVAHKGLAEIMGNDFNKLLNDIYNDMTEEEVSRFEILYNTEDPQIIADEYIAFMAETGTEPNLFERFIAAVRQWFRQYFKVNYSKNEIKSLLSKSRKHLASKAKPTARDYETAGEYMEALTAWHGSPYNITKFSTKKIGTGEGNQMFGYGLYFTDKKDIAEFYARSNANMNDYLSEARNRIGDKGVAWIEKALARTKWDYPATMEYLKVQRDKFNQDPKIFNRFQRIIDYIGVNPFPENRFIYQVLMGKNKTPGQMDWLHYEKPLKNTQVVKIADQLQKEGINNATLEFALWNITPASKIYELLTKQFKSNKKASHFLSRAGIDGMTYPIGTFQQKEQPGRNYVVFNDRDVKINSKTRFKITTNEKGDNDPDDDGSGRPPFNILQSKSEKRVELFQNRMLSVREWQNRIRGKGGKITDLSNPYRQENLSHGIVKNAIESFDEKYLEKIEEAAAGIMEKAGLDYEQLNRYMMAKHAPERNREIAMRNLTKELELPVEVIKHMYDNGSLDKATVDRIDNSVNSGMTTKEANEIVENIEGKLTDRLINNFWKEVNRSTKFSVDRWMADGFISPETHAKISAMYKYYVPLRNWQKTELDEMYEYQSDDIGKTVNPLRSAKGRESLSDDPLQYIVNMAHSAIVMGEKNRVKLHAFRLVRDNKEMNDMHRMRTSYYVYTGKMDQYGNKIWEETFIKPAQEFWEQGNVKTKKDTSHFVRRPASLATQHEVDVFVGGERYTMVLPADVSNALNKAPSKYDDIAFILRDLKIGNIPVPIGKFTRWLSSNFTSKNPTFILMNQIRDLQYAALAHFIKGDAKEAAQFIKILPKARKAIIQHIKGKGNVKDKTYQAYMDFMINGGETGYIHMKDVDQLADDIKKDLSRLTGQNSMLDKTLHADLVRNMGKWLDHMAVRSENLSRFATYLVAKQQGKTNREAAFAAKEITVNFNRKGSISSFLGSLYAFFNAAVQGGDNIIRMGKEHKYKFMAIGATGIAFGFLEALFNNLWGGDDDDQNKYANASDYLKFNNFVLMIPGMEKYITVPLPHGFRWFHSLGVSAYQAISGEKSVGEAMKDAASNAFSSLSPVNPVEFIKDDGSFTIRPIVPTAAVPFYDIAINQTFTGAQVHKEPYTAALKGRIANTALGKDNVNSIVQTFTDFLFKVGGGDPETGSKYYMNDQGKIVPVSNIFDKNPSDIEHVIEYYLGGRGMFWNDVMKTAQNIMEMANSLMEDESFTQAVTDVNMNEFPVLKSLVRQPWRKSVYSTYYDIVNDIENYKAMVRMKNKSIDTESEAPQEYTPDYQYKIELLSDLKKELRGLDEDMQDITDPEMIMEIKQVQERLISNFIEATK